MNNGHITEVGSYTQLIDQNGAFAEFLRNYGIEKNDEEQGIVIKQLSYWRYNDVRFGTENSDWIRWISIKRYKLAQWCRCSVSIFYYRYIDAVKDSSQLIVAEKVQIGIVSYIIIIHEIWPVIVAEILSHWYLRQVIYILHVSAVSAVLFAFQWRVHYSISVASSLEQPRE